MAVGQGKSHQSQTRWIVYGQRDHLDYDLMLVENFL